MKQSSGIHMASVLRISGAFIAYQIGAGFASGQEAMQYFGTYGGMYPILLPIFVGVLVAVYCLISYRTGFVYRFENPNDAYDLYCGSMLGKVINIFTNVSIGLTTLLMFAGCGATLHQYLGVPVWAGAVGIGVLSALVVCLGLSKLTDVLGSCGVVIIAIMVIAGVYTTATADTGLMEAQQHIGTYVEEGIFLQINAFGTHNPILTTINFVGMGLALAMTFNVSIGPNCRNTKECMASAICSGIMFALGIYMCLFTMLYNLDYIAEQEAMVPMLAAIQNTIPVMTLPYTIVVCLGIFTTIAGYLWVIGRRFGGEDGTLRQRIVVVALTVIGITVGSMIPLDQLVNVILAITGYVGIALFVCMLVQDIRTRKRRAQILSEREAQEAKPQS